MSGDPAGTPLTPGGDAWGHCSPTVFRGPSQILWVVTPAGPGGFQSRCPVLFAQCPCGVGTGDPQVDQGSPLHSDSTFPSFTSPHMLIVCRHTALPLNTAFLLFQALTMVFWNILSK